MRQLNTSINGSAPATVRNSARVLPPFAGDELKDPKKLGPVLKYYAELNGGVLPGKNYFRNIGRGDVIQGVRANGYFTEIRNTFGFQAPYALDEPFAEWGNIKPVLCDLSKIFGKLPDQNTLKRDHLIVSCEPTVEAFGKAATSFFEEKGIGIEFSFGENELSSMRAGNPLRIDGYVARIEGESLNFYVRKRNDIIKAVWSYHGGFYETRKKLGETPKMRRNGEALAHNGNFFKTINEILDKYGNRIPGKDTLSDDGYDYFLKELNRRESGLNKIRKMLKQEPHRLEGNDALRLMKNLRPRILAIMKDDGLKLLPGADWEGWNRHKAEYAAIKRNGGVNKMREIIGPQPMEKTACGSFSDKKEIWRVLGNVIDNMCILPKIEWFAKRPKYDLLLQSIYTYHENFWEVRLQLEAAGKTPAVYDHPDCREHAITKWENLLPVLKKLVAVNNGNLPSRNLLHKRGQQIIHTGIMANGGYCAVQARLYELGVITELPYRAVEKMEA